MYEMTGTVKTVKDAKKITDTFTLRELVIKRENGSRIEYYPLRFKNEKAACLEGLKEGDTVKVSFYMDGRMVEKPNEEPRYYVDLNGMKAEKL